MPLILDNFDLNYIVGFKPKTKYQKVFIKAMVVPWKWNIVKAVKLNFDSYFTCHL